MITEKMEGQTPMKTEQAWMAYTPTDDDKTNFGLERYLGKAVLTKIILAAVSLLLVPLLHPPRLKLLV